jgi:hypothetical protein
LTNYDQFHIILILPLFGIAPKTQRLIFSFFLFLDIENLMKLNPKKLAKLIEFKLGKNKNPISLSKNGKISPAKKTLHKRYLLAELASRPFFGWNPSDHLPGRISHGLSGSTL